VTIKTPFDVMTSDEQVESLRDVVQQILSQYAFGEFEFESINHEFNSTFKVTGEDGTRYALRVNVNSDRTRANLNAEIFWVSRIEAVKTPKPVKNSNGEYVTTAWHAASNRELSSVVYTWLEGAEVAEDPTAEQIFAMGAAMAKLHIESVGLQLPADAELPLIDDFLWGMNDLLLGAASKLSAEDQALVAAAKTEIMTALAELSQGTRVQPLHADLHLHNAMWHEGELSVFDFDDSAMGLPVQDIATSLYYLDTEEQDEAFLNGYKSVRALPEFTERQMKLLRLQRRLILLNYIFETSNPEHKAMAPQYAAGSMKRIREVLEIE
jgi:Ser/Thr protein kinase RdoA (MazF antagonist)